MHAGLSYSYTTCGNLDHFTQTVKARWLTERSATGAPVRVTFPLGEERPYLLKVACDSHKSVHSTCQHGAVVSFVLGHHGFGTPRNMQGASNNAGGPKKNVRNL